MKITVVGTCGHEFDVTISGKSSEIERKRKYYQSRMCKECERKAWVEDCASVYSDDLKAGLPAFDTTETKAAWAGQIRHKMIHDVNSYASDTYSKFELALKQSAANAELLQTFEKKKQYYTAIINELTYEIRDAAWFIDNKDEWTIKIIDKVTKLMHDKEREKNRVLHTYQRITPSCCELEGTQKQVEWANKLRAQKIEQAHTYFESLETDSLDAYKAAVMQMSSIVSAKWWIDHRNDSMSELLTAIAKIQA